MVKFYIDPEDFVNNRLNCNAWVATAIVGSAAISGAVTAYSAQSAAGAQGAAANQGNATLRGAALTGQNALEFYNNVAQSYLDPYRQLGQTGTNALTSQLPNLTTPLTVSDEQRQLQGALPVSQQQQDLRDPLQISQAQRDLQSPIAVSQAQRDLQSALPVSQQQQDLAGPLAISQEQMDLRKPITIDQATLESLPGYQFAKTQGLKATQNSAAARGLGVSGAALKGAATFATGLADQNYSTYFNQQMQNNQAAFDRYAATYGQAAAERAASSGRFGQIFQQQTQERQASYGREANTFNQTAAEREAAYGREANTFGQTAAERAAASARETAIFGENASERAASSGRYQTTFADTLQGQQSAYDRLMGTISAGETGAAVGGTLGQKTGQGISTTMTDAARGISGNIVGAGNAQAAADNATGQAVSNVANSIPGAVYAYNNPYGSLYGRNAPNLSYVQGIAGDQRVPTFG